MTSTTSLAPSLSNLTGPFRLSSAIMPALTSEGLRLPGLDTISAQPRFPPLPLGLAELELLVHLIAGIKLVEATFDAFAPRFSSGVAGVVEFLTKLLERDLLTTDAASPEATAAVALRDDGLDVSEAAPASLVAAQGCMSIATPRLFWINGGRFVHVDHEGNARIEMSIEELIAASELRVSLTFGEFVKAQAEVLGERALDRAESLALVVRLDAAGLIERSMGEVIESLDDTMRRGRPTFGRERAGDKDWTRYQRLNNRVRETIRRIELEERQRERHTGRFRTKVVPVQQNGVIPPLALGMIFAYAAAYDGGKLNQHYLFHPDWLMRASKVRGITARPAIFLMSNYNWSHRHNNGVSAKVRELSPTSIIIHGGPNTPKYPNDCIAYLNAHPEVDIAVRGEGEQTVVELLDALKDQDLSKPFDRKLLYGIVGITFRDGEEIVRTAERERIADLDAIPSPYLTGLFDDYAGTELAIIETNRGCPYSCVFCDWGSAIGTRVRQFSLDRVFAELNWCASNEVAGVMCADANFGIFERDVSIAAKVAELKQSRGYPNGFSASAAKNKTKHTKEIIQLLVNAGIMTKGSIGVQSTDPDTLKAVRRSNIKLQAYDELALEFRKSGLPLWTDFMFGLPGQTYGSFKNDLQGCVDRGVFPRMFMTELLVNSPMNDPEFREEYQIESELSPDGTRRLVVATSTFSREDYDEMNRLRLLFIMGDSIGMLRHFAHYVRAETGTREIDFYDGLARALASEPEQWPITRFTVRALPALLVPPVSWQLLAREVAQYLVQRLGIADDSALETLVAVQCCVMPTLGRTMPASIDLAHDYSAWHAQLAKAREAGHVDDWPSNVRPLRDFGPVSFSIDDPDRLCEFGIGATVDGDLFGNYELRSEVARWRVVAA